MADKLNGKHTAIDTLESPEAQAAMRKRFAMQFLTGELLRWVEIMAKSEEDQKQIDALDPSPIFIEAVTGEGPAQAIAMAIAQEPCLWLHAIPEDVAIIPRRWLFNLCGPNGKGLAAQLMVEGSMAVERQAGTVRTLIRDKMEARRRAASPEDLQRLASGAPTIDGEPVDRMGDDYLKAKLDAMRIMGIAPADGVRAEAVKRGLI